jgi:hypothetical protein
VALEDTDSELLACHRCLRAGRAALTHDTRLGMVTWELALAGHTHGRPPTGPDSALTAQFQTSTGGDSGWTRAHVDPAWLLELVHTPTDSNWQGEAWDFCCRRPMAHVGAWGRADLDRHAPDGDDYHSPPGYPDGSRALPGQMLAVMAPNPLLLVDLGRHHHVEGRI